MKLPIKLLAGAAGLAGLAVAAPAAAQYYPYNYGYNYSQYNPYVYGSAYGRSPYGNAYASSAYRTQLATRQCTAAVQSRLNNRTSVAEIIGSFLGANTAGRVVSITKVDPNRRTIRVAGLASSGRNNGYGAYGVGAYGALGYSYRPDLRFRCDVDYRGYVRDVDLRRR